MRSYHIQDSKIPKEIALGVTLIESGAYHEQLLNNVVDVSLDEFNHLSTKGDLVIVTNSTTCTYQKFIVNF